MSKACDVAFIVLKCNETHTFLGENIFTYCVHLNHKVYKKKIRYIFRMLETTLMSTRMKYENSFASSGSHSLTISGRIQSVGC